MLHVRRPVVAGVLAGLVALTGACSRPEPSAPPSAPEVTSTAPTPPSAAPTSASPDATAAPSSPAAPTEQATSAAPEPEPSVEPSRTVETESPKRLDQSTRTAGAAVSLVSVRSTTVKARNPGERSGPGVLVRLRLRNTTAKTLDTGFVQVGLTDSTGTAAVLVDGPPSDPLAASVRSGSTAEGTYAFVTGETSRDPVTVSVSVTEGQPVVTFRGRPR